MNGHSGQRTILVSGASGFIAMHCIVQLLDKGFSVRGTLRTPSREKSLRDTFAKHTSVGDNLSFYPAELMSDEGWREAIDGCDAVVHVASPIPRAPPKHEDELILPAREGVLRVLRWSSQLGVRRVVMTSSLAAVVYGHKRDGTQVYDESYWSIAEGIGAYEKSKTQAERAAWHFMDDLADSDPMEFVAINPGLVLGPILDEDYSTSLEVVRKLMKREFPGCPPLGWAMVDVRDVASAHIAAIDVPDAAGKRFCCATEHAWIRDVALILDRYLKDKGYRIPTGKLPGFLLRIVALFDKTTRLAVQDLNLRQDVSTEQIRRVLDWQPRSLETMVTDTADALMEHGVA